MGIKDTAVQCWDCPFSGYCLHAGISHFKAHAHSVCPRPDSCNSKGNTAKKFQFEIWSDGFFFRSVDRYEFW